jgi:indolepyruvate ferredoxin oxidoreductase alpha subunit
VKIVTGNEALAQGALRAGVKVFTGYPGTPSTGALTCLLNMELGPDRHVEWSTNEKVAFEIATGVSWAGQRALCTMKMSGLNVAFDSVISVAYSGCKGGLVIYVADDPGASAGMAEQDSRGFAYLSNLPILEPSSVPEAYGLIQAAFGLSEQVGSPVLFRMVTSVAHAYAAVEIEPPLPPLQREVVFEKDIAKYTKAGSAICLAQHRDLIRRLEKAYRIIGVMGLNSLQLADKPVGLGIIANGVPFVYLEEAFEIATRYGFDPKTASVLKVVAANPFPIEEVQTLLRHCDRVLVLEELEPILEREVYVEAHKIGYEGKIFGKLEGPLSRIGEYELRQVVEGLRAALDLDMPQDLFLSGVEAEQLAALRPITVCAGCPHRGTFMAIHQAIKRSRLKKDEVIVTGDIGCTILGMNPPFDTIWTEISMGASLGLAQGYVHAGVKTPVIATIGDSTFFHAGLPGLINAIQYQVPLTLIIMDNGWTCMTGMQINPGTSASFQPCGGQRLDIARIVPALGVEHFFIVDPFDYAQTTKTIQDCLALDGVKVVLARQECAIQAQRRGEQKGILRVLPENCNLCSLCLMVTGCPAIDLGEKAVVIDPALCYGCGLCAEVCNREALLIEETQT